MRRIPGLDVLRFVAVLLVLFRHVSTSPAALLKGGWIGVDLFFVLSGWLVSGLLFKEYQRTGDVRPCVFLIRRGFKIYPAFWCFLMFSAWWVPKIQHAPISGRSWMAELLFFQNYSPGLWVHTWSLAVEEHFYIMLAVLVWVLVRSSRLHLIPLVALGIAVGCLFLRVITAMLAPGETALYRDFFPTHLRIDSLMFGVVISYWHHFAPEGHWIRDVRALPALIAGAILLLPPFLFSLTDRSVAVLAPVSCYIGSGLLVLAVHDWRTVNPFALFFARLGAASYSTYLWHHVFVDAAAYTERRYDQHVPIVFIFVGSFLAGLIMTRLVEAPFLALRDRLTGTRKTAPGAVDMVTSSI